MTYYDNRRYLVGSITTVDVRYRVKFSAMTWNTPIHCENLIDSISLPRTLCFNRLWAHGAREEGSAKGALRVATALVKKRSLSGVAIE
jgi:hypothetical protein